MDAPPKQESHGKLARVSPAGAFQFHLVFSNKTESDGYCLAIWTELTARGVTVWQQKKNIPKDSDNWFSEWYPSANVSTKIVCFLTAAYLQSIYCMKEFRVAQAMDKLLVVVCEPMQAIRAVDPGQYPHASDALAYLLGGGQVIFADSDDVVSEIMRFIPRDTARPESEPEPPPAPVATSGADAAGAWPAELAELVAIPSFAMCLKSLDVSSLADFAECVDVDEGHDALLRAAVDALPSKPRKSKLLRNRAQASLADLLQRLAFFIEYDSEEKGSLSRVDCLRIPAEQMRARAGGTIGEHFDAIDTDRDGRVSFEELFLAAEVPAGEGVPPAQEAQRALEEQRVQMEAQMEAQRAQVQEQADAVRRQQSALDKQAAAMEAEKQRAAEAQRKVEEMAASLALAQRLQEEERAPAPEPQAVAREGPAVRNEAELIAALQEGGTACVPPGATIVLTKPLKFRGSAEEPFDESDRRSCHCEFRRTSPRCALRPPLGALAISDRHSRPSVLHAGIVQSAVRITAPPGGKPATLRRAGDAGQYEYFVKIEAKKADGGLELQGLRIETGGWAPIVCVGAHCRAELRDCTLSGRRRAVAALAGAKVQVEGGALCTVEEGAYAQDAGSEILVRPHSVLAPAVLARALSVARFLLLSLSLLPVGDSARLAQLKGVKLEVSGYSAKVGGGGRVDMRGCGGRGAAGVAGPGDTGQVVVDGKVVYSKSK